MAADEDPSPAEAHHYVADAGGLFSQEVRLWLHTVGLVCMDGLGSLLCRPLRSEASTSEERSSEVIA